uniref:Uncharacterized protein n=1 Tax=Oryza glaberrima TaxID=4538 RepID=I1P591_ORYGL
MRLRTCVMLLPCWCREACCIWLVSERHTADTSELVMNNHIMCGIGVKKSSESPGVESPCKLQRSRRCRSNRSIEQNKNRHHHRICLDGDTHYEILFYHFSMRAAKQTEMQTQHCKSATGMPMPMPMPMPKPMGYLLGSPREGHSTLLRLRTLNCSSQSLSGKRAGSSSQSDSFVSPKSSCVCLSSTNFLVLGKLFHNPLSNECIIDLVSRYELGLTDWWRREYGGLDFAYGTQQKTQASNDSVLL